MKDKTKGYKNGDKCPKCGGLIQIRTTTMIERGKEIPSSNYAQCTKCSWNSMR
jgi:hypothetical protein